jgi:succinate-semialdehyde dehydrogenase/glutarate-semialdehyde dehydrogenase
MAIDSITEIQSVNPATGQTIQTYEPMPDEEVRRIIDGTHAAFDRWRRTDLDERARLVHAVGSLLRDRAEEYARLMAEAMGKPLGEGRAEAEKCAWV